MRCFCIFLLGSVMLVPLVSHGQSKCPWINEGTAGGILGGTTSVSAKVSDQGDGNCEFLVHQGAVTHQLSISVAIMSDLAKQFPDYLAQCGPKGTPLAAIGNEAVLCELQDKSDGYGEQIVGRVRDQAFVLKLTTSLQHDPSMTADMRRQKLNLAAQQVAGILF